MNVDVSLRNLFINNGMNYECCYDTNKRVINVFIHYESLQFMEKIPVTTIYVNPKLGSSKAEITKTRIDVVI